MERLNQPRARLAVPLAHGGDDPVVFGPARWIATPPGLKASQLTGHRTCSPACCEVTIQDIVDGVSRALGNTCTIKGTLFDMAFAGDRDLAKDVECLERSQRLPVVRPGGVRRSTRLHSRRDMPCWRGSLLRRVPTSGGWSLHLRVLSAPKV